MQKSGFTVDSVTLSVALYAASDTGDLQIGKSVKQGMVIL